MTKLQNGCIQTIIDSFGKFEYYRATLWVPKEFADRVNPDLIQVHNTKSKLNGPGLKYLYCPISKDWDELWKMITQAQIIIANIKMLKLEKRRSQLYDRLELSQLKLFK